MACVFKLQDMVLDRIIDKNTYQEREVHILSPLRGKRAARSFLAVVESHNPCGIRYGSREPMLQQDPKGGQSFQRQTLGVAGTLIFCQLAGTGGQPVARNQVQWTSEAYAPETECQPAAGLRLHRRLKLLRQRMLPGARSALRQLPMLPRQQPPLQVSLQLLCGLPRARLPAATPA